MPIAYRIFTDIDLCYARWTGQVTFREAYSSWMHYVADPDYRPGRPELIDHSGILSFDISVGEMQALLRFINRQDFPDAQGTQTIVLAISPVAFGVARQYQNLADLMSGIEVQVLRTEAEALAALGRPERTLAELLEGRWTED